MSELPPECDVGFKEWSGVCDALASGEQTLILRKGGIAEDGGGFTPEHRAFWLYPTRLHESQQGLRIESTPSGAASPDAATVPIRSLAMVEAIHHLDREDRLDALEPFHVWTAETVHKRFHYRRPGLWVLSVRVWTKPAPAVVVVTPEQLGCKTWVPLEPPLPTLGLAPVLDAERWAARREHLRKAMESL
ncbi:DUF1802 family protein [Planctomyces sp. SH-PL62]|uniref:DUF1802 family protein n=1 Tax=Planctomyces sp. SH-PL62 TaxID=1636152 RepID=UPI00078D11B8|nr:DUF1802 family protein [Planctomyces sp. SH-PL62]AMV39648.1 hypothetical protein VT85_19590 [Planctomyces sp. SH-PL62]